METNSVNSEEYCNTNLLYKIAVFLTRCLTSRNYFGKGKFDENCEFDVEQLSIGRWIHSLMRIAKFNR